MAFEKKTLTDLGLNDDQVKGVMVAHGEALNDMKQKLATAESERDTANGQIADITEQLNTAKKSAEKGSEAEKQATELQAQLDQAKKDADEQLQATKLAYEIDSALTAKGAKNVKATKALIDTDKVSFDDKGNLIGLTEQVEAVKADNAFLFEGNAPVEPKPGVKVFPNGNPGTGSNKPVDISKMSYKEQVAYKQQNPEAYAQATQTQGE